MKAHPCLSFSISELGEISFLQSFQGRMAGRCAGSRLYWRSSVKGRWWHITSLDVSHVVTSVTLLEKSTQRGAAVILPSLSPSQFLSFHCLPLQHGPASPHCSSWCSEHPCSQLCSSSSGVKILLGPSVFSTGYVELREVTGSRERSDFIGLEI